MYRNFTRLPAHKKGVFPVFSIAAIPYIGLSIIASGLIYADSYYQCFGIRFQSLDFNSMYIFYKGLVMIISYPIILLPYFFTVVILFFNLFAAGKVPRWLVSSRMFFLYLLIFDC